MMQLIYKTFPLWRISFLLRLSFPDIGGEGGQAELVCPWCPRVVLNYDAEFQYTCILFTILILLFVYCAISFSQGHFKFIPFLFFWYYHQFCLLKNLLVLVDLPVFRRLIDIVKNLCIEHLWVKILQVFPKSIALLRFFR